MFGVDWRTTEAAAAQTHSGGENTAECSPLSGALPPFSGHLPAAGAVVAVARVRGGDAVQVVLASDAPRVQVGLVPVLVLQRDDVPFADGVAAIAPATRNPIWSIRQV